MVDFDEVTNFNDYVLKPCLNAYDKYDLGGFKIMKSSENSYHVIFDRIVSWEENVEILAWLWF